MKNKKGFTLVELLSVIVLLGIIITIGIFSVSSIRKTILDRQYKNVKTEIELAAEKYYSDTESTEVYVDTLIKEGYLKADNKSMTITDPRDKTSLNCHIVTINDNEEGNLGIESNIDENGNCNEEAIVNSEISIVDIDGNKINKTWYKSPITLKVKFNNSEKEPNSYDYTWKSEKNPNVISDEPIYNLENLYNERGYVIDDEFYVTLVNAEETLESKGQRVRIKDTAENFPGEEGVVVAIRSTAMSGTPFYSVKLDSGEPYDVVADQVEPAGLEEGWKDNLKKGVATLGVAGALAGNAMAHDPMYDGATRPFDDTNMTVQQVQQLADEEDKATVLPNGMIKDQYGNEWTKEDWEKLMRGEDPFADNDDVHGED